MYFSADEILNKLSNTPDKRLNRTLYEIEGSIYTVHVNKIKDWEKLIFFLLTTPRYQNCQGLSHWFDNLRYSDFQEGELLFLLPVFLDEIDKLNQHAFFKLSDFLAKHISSRELQCFIGKLKRHDSELSKDLAWNIEQEIFSIAEMARRIMERDQVN